MDSDSSLLIQELAQTLYEKKARNIIALDVKQTSSETHFILIADGNVERHVIAIAHEIRDVMKKKRRRLVHSQGMEHGDWIVLDFFDVVVHLFISRMREKYQLERFWESAKIIDIEFNFSSNSRG